MSDVDDLVNWLRAQLDDDERVARAAARGPWEYQDIDSVGGGRICDPGVAIATVIWDNDQVDPRIRRSVSWQEADGTGEHIARHDSARVLAEVDAKRRILDEHDIEYPGEPFQYCRVCHDRSSHDATAAPCWTLRLLAMPYADRPGYRNEWKP